MPFQQGNSKLGKKIWTYSIPAGDTCPYKTDACSKECYAADGFFLMPNVKKSLQKNWDETKKDTFDQWAISELKRVKAKVVRVHVAGDLYDLAYVKKWYNIFKACSDTRFFIYTRSWIGKELRPAITKMAKLKNVRMWWSVDKDTGAPKRVPKNVRLAYMQTTHEDLPSYKVDLFFRVDRLYDRVAKKINNALVCPVENGITKDMNCMKCGYCWRDRDEKIDWASKAQRLALPIVSS